MALKFELEKNRVFRLYKSRLNKRNSDLEELQETMKRAIREPIVREINEQIKTPPPVIEEKEEEVEVEERVKPTHQVVYVSTPEVQASIDKKKEKERIRVETIAEASAELNETITTDKVVTFPERPKEEMLPTLTIEQAVKESNEMPNERHHKKHHKKDYKVFDYLHQHLIDTYFQSQYWSKEGIQPNELFINSKNELMVLQKYRLLMNGVVDKATQKLIDRVLDTQPHKHHWYSKKK